MAGTEDFLAPRTCLLSPLPGHDAAAQMLSEAADAMLARDRDLARDLLRRADLPVLFEHASLVMSGRDPNVQRRRPVAAPTEKVEKIASRMPSGAETKALFARDGWRCRFCECRVVPPKVRTAMRAALPGAIPWSETEGFHGAFFAMSASVDHIVPHSAGGFNDVENLVTACWSCQFGRGAWTLEEVGLLSAHATAREGRLGRSRTFDDASRVVDRCIADDASADGVICSPGPRRAAAFPESVPPL
jgi:hypothetical protein